MQAFRLIDRENKGYISRQDVWRILDTTNVQDLEQAHQQASASHTVSTHNVDSASPTAAGAGAGASAGASGGPAATNATNLAGAASSRRGSSVEGGSGRTTGSAAEEAAEARSRKLEQRIDEIMLQADVNSDGVIR